MKILSMLIGCLLTCALPLAAQTTRILFIGNSYTGVNNLPTLVRDVALANGDSVIVDSYTPGGYTFELHTTDGNTIAKIYSQQWDYVVLQEQSQLPSFHPGQVALDVYPYAATLDSMIHDNNACTETVFYMTWGRKNGDASNCASYPPVCTYEGMQARLRESYIQLGMLNTATVSPVGAAWRYLRSLNPVFDLYQPDESHPSMHGSYLAACVFYATIFHKSPVGTSFIASLPQADATAIQAAAEAVVTDSISLWYQYGNIPMASFSYSATGNDFQFQNHSLNATTQDWNFGDGGTSIVANPTHNYAASGTYTVSLTVDNGCKTDELVLQVTTGVSGISESTGACSVSVNGTSQEFQLECGNLISEAHLFDIRGRKVKGNFISHNGKFIFQCGDLPAGIYVLQVVGDNFRWTGKVLR